ncbi:hypothetical protein [Paractinoplanes atraurantiacus]|uniref:Uncharacterized protein n=1 Tax=Paractinoplanes atraurantiacus TaxID=1036182 RepID=A0A285IIE0_9ACTN|nr:hypothetical protein [Actinoplanes atraurantiacus]SNY47724.1 hypothetical protein SAMN05421748_108199 [Actinoplanes atraurantiacus]
MYFVCRWREESPFGKRVVALPDATVLDWFRRGWGKDDPDEWIETELGGDVYGLDSIFDKARKRGLPPPETTDQLRTLLHEHLYVEADDKSDYIRLGRHALRVRTDDDEVDLAYYFVDDETAAASPDRLAFLLNDKWPLPKDSSPSAAHFGLSVPVRTARLVRPGPEAVFSVRLCWESPDIDRNLDLRGAVTIPGLTLPDLAAVLHKADDQEALRWPHDLRLLRQLITSSAESLGGALHTYARHPRSLVEVGPHIAQVARYIDDFVGFDQWFLFDTRWATAHADLAHSLLRYAAHWDPYAG